MQVTLAAGLSDVGAEAWDALVGDDDPFVEHAFLRALEQSGSVGPGTGWTPCHVLVREQGRLVSALPLYRKDHSYGEYIFDFGWAAAAERAGLLYYPKLVSMVPFTPATGRRLLHAPDVPREAVVGALLEGMQEAARRTRASSLHVHFLTEDERHLLGASGAFLPRETLQFHFHNDGYASFDDYLGRLRSALRKQVRRERRQAAEHGLEIRVLEGQELGAREVSALFSFYEDTCHKRGSGPYLNRRFFELLAADHARRIVAVLAYRGKEPVAGTISFEKGKHLYGRYWGAKSDLPALHFECCYYRLIERAIERGLTRFEAGAQGSHKLRRGLMPATIHSLHAIGHPGLHAAVAQFLDGERLQNARERAELAEHGPFRRDGEPAPPG